MVVVNSQIYKHLIRFPLFMRGTQWPISKRFVATEENKAAASNDQSTPPPSKEVKIEDFEKLQNEVSILSNKNVELEDKYKRSLAESENMRRRFTKQIDDAKIFGIQSFCKDLLVVYDVLEHATKSVPKEEVTSDKNPSLKNLYEGLTMTKAQLLQVFKRNGLEQINPMDQKFDPNFHEALFQQEVPNKDPNTVVVVNQVGYKLRDRCIRPAIVGVSK